MQLYNIFYIIWVRDIIAFRKRYGLPVSVTILLLLSENFFIRMDNAETAEELNSQLIGKYILGTYYNYNTLSWVKAV